jgi:hypothetical protein
MCDCASLLSVNPAIKPLYQLCGANRECVAYTQKSGNRYGSACLDLLPMASREPKPNHIFLGESLGLSEPFHPFSKGCKELVLVDQA